MIDKYGLIVDRNGDGGDSCNFTSCAIAIGIYDPMRTAQAVTYFWNNGRPLRHPFQKPWDNPKNFTRDQAVLLMQILSPEQILKFLEDNKWTFPNTERDSAGSTKYQRPHVFYKDSHPTAETVVKQFNFWKFRFEGSLPPARWIDERGEWDAEIEEKSFDSADLMTPDFTAMCLILAGKKPNFLHMGAARFLCRRAIDDHCKQAKADKTYADFKQLYFTAKALDLHKEFASQHPWGLYYAANYYFTVKRNLPEIELGFIREFQKEGIHE